MSLRARSLAVVKPSDTSSTCAGVSGKGRGEAGMKRFRAWKGEPQQGGIKEVCVGEERVAGVDQARVDQHTSYFPC
eukprot:364232-Chlamydomonas_euryale.AAC.2